MDRAGSSLWVCLSYAHGYRQRQYHMWYIHMHMGAFLLVHYLHAMLYL